jgi:hypothetical protein
MTADELRILRASAPVADGLDATLEPGMVYDA